MLSHYLAYRAGKAARRTRYVTPDDHLPSLGEIVIDLVAVVVTVGVALYAVFS